MNEAQIKHLLENMVPFNSLVGSKVVEVDADHAVCTLEQRPEISNHLDTIHAGALFTIGEGTAGAVISVSFDVVTYPLMLKTAEVRYRRPIKRATAVARLDAALREQALAELNETGRVDLPIDVVIKNENDEEAYIARYVWAMRRR